MTTTMPDYTKAANSLKNSLDNTVKSIPPEFLEDNSVYIYSAGVLIPLIIATITILTLTISPFTKVILVLLLIITICVYIMQLKKINVASILPANINKTSSNKGVYNGIFNT